MFLTSALNAKVGIALNLSARRAKAGTLRVRGPVAEHYIASVIDAVRFSGPDAEYAKSFESSRADYLLSAF